MKLNYLKLILKNFYNLATTHSNQIPKKNHKMLIKCNQNETQQSTANMLNLNVFKIPPPPHRTGKTKITVINILSNFILEMLSSTIK